jgi:hypothetical protein
MDKERFAFLVLTMFCVMSSASLKSQNYKKVLWLGTSIPEGCTYPQVACEQNNMVCTNKAVASSFLCKWSDDLEFHDYVSGLSLTMSAAEKETMFRKYVNKGIITEERLNFWKSTSYETLLLPYVKDVDIVVIDHGFNTPDHNSTENIYNEGEANVDWDSEDRTNFIGAFNFIYRLITSINPDALVVVGGYFQNSCTLGFLKRGLWASHVLTWIANHYHIPLLDTWNYTGIPDGYIPDSQDYLAELNALYHTDFEKLYPDKDGNITYYQKFCPDGWHPFSDPTGESDKILNSIFTYLLNSIINGTINMKHSASYQWDRQGFHYNLNGIRMQHRQKGLHIISNIQKTRKVIVK